MSATTVLREEHVAILRMADVMETLAGRLGPGESVGATQLQKVDAFLDGFIGCHQAKEEELLFPAIMGSDAPVVFGVMGRLVADHGKGRLARTVIDDALRAGVTPGAASSLAAVLEEYAGDIRRHIALEETECFDVADRALFPEVQDSLEQGYDDIERERFGESQHVEFHAMLVSLESDTAAMADSG